MSRTAATCALFVVTACVLAFEVALTRICSVLLQHHMIFAVVSLAVLGLGLGGFVAFASTRRRSERIPLVASVALLAIAPAMLVALASLVYLPFAASWPVLLFLIVPVFVATGVFQSLVLRSLPHHAGRLYAADLAGGAVGALGSVLLLDALAGPVNTVLVLVVVAASLALLWCLIGARAVERGGPAHGDAANGDAANGDVGRRRRVAASALVVLALVALPIQAATGILAIDYTRTPDKLIHRMLEPTPEGTPRLVPELERWDAHSRVDVVELETPRGSQRLVFIDGETPTAMLPPGSRAPGIGGKQLRDALPALPYRVLAPRSVLSIGSGAGYDVAVARLFGSRRIDAVELNAAVLDVAEAARDYTGDIYAHAGVRVLHGEGRQFLATSPPDTYDLIVLVLAQSLASNLQEYALSENYLYTLEAFEAYLRVLRDGGAVSILVNNTTLLRRLASTAFEALEARGLPSEECVVALASPSEDPYDHLLLLSTRPFGDAQLAALTLELRYRGYVPFHVPVALASPGGRHPLAASSPAAASDVPRWTRAELRGDPRFHLEPATDDRPFFFHVHRGVPRGLAQLLVAVSAILLLAAAVTGRLVRAASVGERRATLGVAGYFVVLGLGFMMVEVIVLQKTVLLIGFPTWNLAVVLATFLLSAGLGSVLSPRILRQRARARLRFVLCALGVGLLALVPLLDLLRDLAHPLPLLWRCVLVSAVLAPFAFVMGVPFPAGVRLLRSTGVPLVPWFWGLNGVASILASGATVAIVLEAGFRLTSLVPAVLYLLGALLAGGLRAEFEAAPAPSAAAPADARASVSSTGRK